MRQDSAKAKSKFNIPKPIIPDKKIKFHFPEETLKSLRTRVEEKIIFSFRFLDREHSAFNLGDMEKRKVAVCGEWFVTFLDSLKEISGLTKNELMSQRQHYDVHDYEWERLKYKFSFEEDFFEQVNCLQFRLTTSKGRVHGFMVGNRFYVVWLDPHHNLYPDDRFGGEKYYSKPETCFEKLQQEIIKLRLENQELLNLLDEATC